MKSAELLERTARSDELVEGEEKSKYALNVVGVYQDTRTHSWAAPMCHLVTQLAKDELVQNRWFHVGSLTDAGIFHDAVHAALEADVIVITLYAAEELPLNLYVWIDAWLPRRRSRLGALTALIGVTEPPNAQPAHTLDYLRDVARRAQLDFIPQPRVFSL